MLTLHLLWINDQVQPIYGDIFVRNIRPVSLDVVANFANFLWKMLLSPKEYVFKFVFNLCQNITTCTFQTISSWLYVYSSKMLDKIFKRHQTWYSIKFCMCVWWLSMEKLCVWDYFSNVKIQDLCATINLSRSKISKIKDLEDKKIYLKHLYNNILIGFLEKPGLNYCCKTYKTVYGIVSFRLICFQIQTIL